MVHWRDAFMEGQFQSGESDFFEFGFEKLFSTMVYVGFVSERMRCGF